MKFDVVIGGQVIGEVDIRGAFTISPEQLGKLASLRPQPREHTSGSIALAPSTEADNSADLAVAIGEHAFRAGWQAATHQLSQGVYDVNTAWSAYDPPEDLKGRQL